MENRNSFLKIKKLLKFAYNNRYSDFYREKYKKAGFNPLTDFKSIEDIRKIPFLTKEELLKANLYKLLFVNEKDVLCTRSTSGTTKKPLYLFLSKQDKKHWSKQTEINFGKILILFNAPNAYFQSIGTKHCTTLWASTGDLHDLPAAARMAADLQVNTIYTIPPLAIILSDYLKDYPSLKKSLKYLYLAGEVVSPKKKKSLQILYPGVKIFFCYGCAETLGLGLQCEYLAKADQIYFHSLFDINHTEIINPKTEKEVGMGEKGEIVVTSLYLFSMPIIRYKTGDLGSLKKGKDCPCGYPGPLLQVWGRVNYDIVKAGGFELRKEFLEKAIDSFKNLLKDSFEAHVYENFEDNKPKIRIELNFSLKKGVRESILLKQRIEKELLENWQVSSKLKLKKAIEAGLFEPVKINFIEFPFSAKTRKSLVLHQG